MLLQLLFAAASTIIAYHYGIFELLPAELAAPGVRGDAGEAIKKLELILRFPSLFGDAGRVDLLYYLGDRCASVGRYGEAMSWFTRLLAVKWISSDKRVKALGRCAHCCERLGNASDAAKYRRNAVSVAYKSPRSYTSVHTFVDYFERLQQFAGVCKIIDAALLSVELLPDQRSFLLTELAIAAGRDGQQRRSMDAAEEALSAGLTVNRQMIMHKAAVISYAGLGDLQNAQRHADLTFGLAKQENNIAWQSTALAQFADLARKRGELTSAVEIAIRAAAMQQPPNQAVVGALFEALLAVGRYQQAWNALTQQNEDIHLTPHDKRKYSGLDHMRLARVYLEVGMHHEARRHIKTAIQCFSGSKTMETYCRAVECVVLVNLGLSDACRDSMHRVIDMVESVLDGQVGNTAPHAFLVRAAYLLGNHEQCIGLLDRYRELPHISPDLAKTLFFAGESCVRAGDLGGALALFREAAESCPEAFYASRSLKRANELAHVQ